MKNPPLPSGEDVRRTGEGKGITKIERCYMIG
jgi:hypothetical protein